MRHATARNFALSLPGVIEAPHHDYNSWRVGKAKRIFVTIPPDEAHLHIFVDDATREEALVMHAAFAEKLLWGGKVVGLRVNLDKAESAIVKRLIRQAWSHKGGHSGGVV
ncbi:MAG: MmcQ/YjbR family DNA-binding protein [Betaproteobacteria bacterium]|nr:MmcQ/YjbR family DNA-binding protein [Betaproteobacteria bacterium]